MKDLKNVNLKVPPVLRDLHSDLRDRHLLPLVGLLLVAIVAAPFLLSESSSPSKPPMLPSPQAAQSGAAPAVAVVRAAPGLRKPGERLRHRKPTDPFKQKYVSPPLSEKPVTVEGASGSDEESDADAEGGGTGSPAATGPSTTEVRSEVIFYTKAATIKIIRSETKASGEVEHEEPVIRSRVLPTTTLPGEKAQVVTYMGTNPKSHLPTFLISDRVSAVFGEGHCLAGTERCQLIELKENEPELFVYGANDVRYRIVVLATEIVETGRADPPGP